MDKDIVIKEVTLIFKVSSRDFIILFKQNLSSNLVIILCIKIQILHLLIEIKSVLEKVIIVVI